ncbi:P-loop containing nucleoside triphosphate hydrolase protein [Microdochium trichocladiopsis]|uniref:RNA helicase n=1 Tax=Microdochium trichocladiopsis TaxID=1682393 RepID=A0A9P8Y949_9PEZI|nr:P-loop containing nucleoside triphosphate hydrolase protein [Microdochium trichocladiopsis]KAH7031236.1 P-loop containing nucleoside triphosphate hydrolase protein [Microdochium trichocladiopsis]
MQSSLCRAASPWLYKPAPASWRSISTSRFLARNSSPKLPRAHRGHNPLAKLLGSTPLPGKNPRFKAPYGVSNQSPLSPPRDASHTYDAFKRLVLTRIDLVFAREGWAHNKAQWRAFGLNTQEDFDKEAKLFRLAVEKACDLATSEKAIGKNNNPLFWSLRKGFVDGDVSGLTGEIQYSFQNFLMRTRFPKNIVATQQAMADFRFPYEWFPATRAMQRTIHLHVGPTNSGKTYNALKALENARSGIYAGPLRLLAHEVYSRFIAKGKSCALVTGEEQRIPTDSDTYFRSCTVEMTPLNNPVDVAVIDEIQMIGDSERGWAWTQAVLGVQAREVHLCGEERSVDLIKSICATTGDKLVIHQYKRLSPLKTMDESLRGNFNSLEKGDCVVTFSRVGIHALKKTIEQRTGRRVAIVYGSLPPETRAQQAALFNDPNNDYDFLVASDAIGMGLNLEIKRVIFEQTHKRTATTYRQMEISELKQIGGRAGRFRTAAHAIKSGASSSAKEGDINVTPPKQIGLVTTLEPDDLPIVQRAFSQDAEQLKTAGIQPPPAVLERFSSYFPQNTPLTYILMRLRDIAQVSPRYHICTTGEMLKIANLIQAFPMPIYDRCVFLNAPVFLREDDGIKILQAYAKCVSDMSGGHLLDIPEINLELLDQPKDDDPFVRAQHLRKLETLHKAITLYLWLSYRYSGVFHSQHLAFHVKQLVETQIDEHLAEVTESDSARKKRLKQMRRIATNVQRKKQKLLGDDIPAEGEQHHEVPGDWNEPGHEEPLYEDQRELESASSASESTK